MVFLLRLEAGVLRAALTGRPDPGGDVRHRLGAGTRRGEARDAGRRRGLVPAGRGALARSDRYDRQNA